MSLSCNVTAQGLHRLADSLSYRVEMQATLSDGDHAPLWLTANRHGLSTLETWGGYVRATAERRLTADAGRRWGVGYALDLAVADGFTSRFVVQQAYIEARWLKGVLTLGSKEQPIELKNQELSSGSQALGINARPVPQLRLSLPDYWVIPGIKGWLALKGHISLGVTTDDRWQKDFTQQRHRFTKHTMLHTKAGYLRVGPKNITFEGGLEMATQFGGSTWQHDSTGWAWYDNERGMGALMHALIPGGGNDLTDGTYSNSGGNHLGAWVARFNMDFCRWGLSVYGEHFFEDQSSMLQTGAAGYGEGSNWNKRSGKSIFLYELKDFMLGAELRLKRFPWVSNVVVEYLTTRYQSGPVYHDHSRGNSVQITGCDDYYNHKSFSGWQHWGMVMGNPLYLSPLYNADGWLEVRDNRFRALHVAAGGCVSRLRYRLMATWQRGWGSYAWLYPDPRDNFSLMGEAIYDFSPKSPLRGWGLRLGVALDRGEIYGDNTGLQLTVSRRGWL
ncbi:MAG: capsule assembly Wzi family protein [Prevotella sp.]|nr:capsule assembly Wzi family protein [Prevotella sp.]